MRREQDGSGSVEGDNSTRSGRPAHECTPQDCIQVELQASHGPPERVREHVPEQPVPHSRNAELLPLQAPSTLTSAAVRGFVARSETAQRPSQATPGTPMAPGGTGDADKNGTSRYGARPSCDGSAAAVEVQPATDLGRQDRQDVEKAQPSSIEEAAPSVLLARTCWLLQTTVEEMQGRLANPWMSIFLIHGLAVIQIPLYLVTFGWGCRWYLPLAIPAILFSALCIPKSLFNASFRRATLRTLAGHKIMLLATTVLLSYLRIYSNLVSQEKGPFQNRFYNGLVGFLMVTITNLRAGVMLTTSVYPHDIKLRTMLLNACLTSAETMDAMTDISTAAQIYHLIKNDFCVWNGGMRCDLYQIMLVGVAVAAGVEWAINTMFILFRDHLSSDRIRIALACLRIATELVILTVTVILGYQGSHTAAVRSISAANPAAAGLAFYVLSGSLTLVAFITQFNFVQRLLRKAYNAARKRTARVVPISLGQVSGWSNKRDIACENLALSGAANQEACSSLPLQIPRMP